MKQLDIEAIQADPKQLMQFNKGIYDVIMKKVLKIYIAIIVLALILDGLVIDSIGFFIVALVIDCIVFFGFLFSMKRKLYICNKQGINMNK